MAGKAIQNDHKSQIGFLWCIVNAKENITQSDSAKENDNITKNDSAE